MKLDSVDSKNLVIDGRYYSVCGPAAHLQGVANPFHAVSVC